MCVKGSTSDIASDARLLSHPELGQRPSPISIHVALTLSLTLAPPALGSRNGLYRLERSLKEEPTKKPEVPAVYIVKYNRFVDNILEKMNDILRRSYDPVNVKLQPIDAKKKSSKPKKNKTKTKSKNKRKQTTRAGNSAAATDNKTIEALTKTNEINDVSVVDKKIEETLMETPQKVDSRVLKENTDTKSAKSRLTTTGIKPPNKTTKPKPKPPAKNPATTKKPVTKNKTKTGQKSKPRAKGTLYGLSSLRRTGDVAVNILSDHTTVKSNFAVGPLILKVEKEVRVDSNHERTRELVWQRSARIAHVVSEKLLSASKPMFLQQYK
ncbi:unnamed protein product, partial [Iphiclides podalirius]